MPKKRSQVSPINADQYMEFIKSVHLSGLGIDAASFKIDREGFAASFPEMGKPSAQISVGNEVVHQKSDSFVILGKYKVSVKGKSGTDVVDISCTCSAMFSVEKEFDQACLERFMRNEVQLVFWPYLRHFVSDSTYRMAIYPLILPLTSEIRAQESEKTKGRRVAHV